MARICSVGCGVMLAAIIAAGCGPPAGLVERGLERELPALIGPADDYDVQIEGLRTRSGEADHVLVTGQRVQMEGAPVLDRLEADLRGVRYNRGERRLERVESAHATVFLRADDVAAFLEAHRNVEDVSVAFQEPDRATIRARPTLSGFSLAGLVEITGRLVSEAGAVRYEVSEVRAAGLSVGGALARRLSDGINPVADLSDTPMALQVTGVRVESGVLRLEGTGEVTSDEVRVTRYE